MRKICSRDSQIRGTKRDKSKLSSAPKLVTSWGGTAALFSRCFDKIGFRELVEKMYPVQESSKNSTGVYSKLISLFVSVLNGGTKFSHINYMENGVNIFERCFRVKRLVKSSTGITRYWNKYNCRSLNELIFDFYVIQVEIAIAMPVYSWI